MTEKMYTVDQLAEIFSYHPQTIRLLIREGRIHAFRLGKGNRSPYRISQAEVERLKIVGFDEQMEKLKEYFKGES